MSFKSKGPLQKIWHADPPKYGKRNPPLCHMNRFYWGWGWSSICWFKPDRKAAMLGAQIMICLTTAREPMQHCTDQQAIARTQRPSSEGIHRLPQVPRCHALSARPPTAFTEAQKETAESWTQHSTQQPSCAKSSLSAPDKPSWEVYGSDVSQSTPTCPFSPLGWPVLKSSKHLQHIKIAFERSEFCAFSLSTAQPILCLHPLLMQKKLRSPPGEVDANHGPRTPLTSQCRPILNDGYKQHRLDILHATKEKLLQPRSELRVSSCVTSKAHHLFRLAASLISCWKQAS